MTDKNVETAKFDTPIVTASSASVPAPLKKVPSKRVFHGDEFIDNYEWVRDKESPELLAHLEAENTYSETALGQLKDLREQLVSEYKKRTKEDDVSVPIKNGSWWYWTATRTGENYPTYFRCPVLTGHETERPEVGTTLDESPAGSQIVLDCNKMAEGEEFFRLSSVEIDKSGQYVLIGVDNTGGELYDASVYEIATGKLVDNEVKQSLNPIWDGTGRYFFYAKANDAWRFYQIWRHEIGTPASEDQLILQEDDDRFNVYMANSRNQDWIVIGHYSTETTEVELLDANDPQAKPWIVCPRQQGLNYEVSPARDHLVITHNHNLADFEVSIAPLRPSTPAEWISVLKSQPGQRIGEAAAFAGGILVEMRKDALPGMYVIPRLDEGKNLEKPELNADLSTIKYGEMWQIPGAELGVVSAGGDSEWDLKTILAVTESLIVPRSVCEIDLETHTSKLIKRQEVPGYNPDDYVTWRQWATAADGTQIPLTCARRKTVEKGDNPGYLYGYGSYEATMDPTFVNSWISMLDRGVVCAIAHIRGGGEMGRGWYENGRRLSKRNTFTDFIASADSLISSGWVKAGHLAAEGGSAGGLLMGAVANMGADRFRAIHAAVPFVDALTTILNPDLPLTVNEWEEWGNPLEDPEVYAYMKSYTPYENVQALEYPAMYVTTSLNDIRVMYVEPVKWVAQLRETVTNGNDRPIFFHCELVAGHGGKTGRYNKWAEKAREMAFLLDQIGARRLLA